MTMRKHYIPCCVLGLALTSLVGCGGVADRPQVYPVSGTVMYKGEPLEGANVSFHNDEAPRAAAGVTDAEGKFQLSMFGANDGSLAGQHVVTVTKYEAGAAASDGPSEEEMMNDPAALAKMSGNTAVGAFWHDATPVGMCDYSKGKVVWCGLCFLGWRPE